MLSVDYEGEMLSVQWQMSSVKWQLLSVECGWGIVECCGWSVVCEVWCVKWEVDWSEGLPIELGRSKTLEYLLGGLVWGETPEIFYKTKPSTWITFVWSTT